ncbi:hypothetical protein [Bacillus cereus]|uniref:Uncharacterized protein n=1 Tax=Bacillus cereus TaxID=1396 RepID=A0A164QDL4_BACCE|nr:hypothetical protein [Bacillus cereus]KZD71165.1 hypothetical protein B4088_0895 [Bacillus cereus]
MIHMTEEIFAANNFKETPEKVMKVLNDFSKIPAKVEELEKREKWTNVLSIRKTDGSYGLLIKSKLERNHDNNLKFETAKSTIRDYLFENYSLNVSSSVVFAESLEFLVFIPLVDLNGHLLSEIITYCVNEVESLLNS